ncbi:MAG: hypothetical protein Q9169_008607, partial [Polycauliona sp. 2 TL-2023]
MNAVRPTFDITLCQDSHLHRDYDILETLLLQEHTNNFNRLRSVVNSIDKTEQQEDITPELTMKTQPTRSTLEGDFPIPKITRATMRFGTQNLMEEKNQDSILQTRNLVKTLLTVWKPNAEWEEEIMRRYKYEKEISPKPLPRSVLALRDDRRVRKARFRKAQEYLRQTMTSPQKPAGDKEIGALSIDSQKIDLVQFHRHLGVPRECSGVALQT